MQTSIGQRSFSIIPQTHGLEQFAICPRRRDNKLSLNTFRWQGATQR